MNETLPPALSKALGTDNSESSENIRLLLEEIVRQNNEILDMLNDDYDDYDEENDKPVVSQHQKPMFVQLFETVFSWETVLILIIVALLIVPLFREAFN